MKTIKNCQPKQSRALSRRQREQLLSAGTSVEGVKPAFLLGLLGSVALKALL